MTEIVKAYLIGLETKPIKSIFFTDDETPRYLHQGKYLIGDKVVYVTLNIPDTEEFPQMVGDIADVEYLCFFESVKPITFYFNVVLKSPYIKNLVRSSKTQADAFEEAINAGIYYNQHPNNLNPDNLNIFDVNTTEDFKNLTYEKMKKIFTKLSNKQWPCSFFEIINNKRIFVKKLISEDELKL